MLSSGTPTYWKVFSTLAGDSDPTGENTADDPLAYEESFADAFSHVVGGGSQKLDVRKRRLQAKLRVLDNLKERGIVCADICPMPIYTGGGKIDRVNQKTGRVYWTPAHRLGSKDYRNIVRTAFHEYALPMIKELRPKRVLVLGKNAETAIGGLDQIAALVPEGCEVLDTMRHPSDIKLQGKKYLPQLRTLRKYAIEAAAESKKFRVAELGK